MPGNRKAAEAQLLADIEAIENGPRNAQMYREWFATLTDAQFDKWCEMCEKGETRVSFIAPIQSDIMLEPLRLLKLARSWGREIWERVWMPAKAGVPSYLSNHRYYIFRLSARRQAQHLVKKRSIPEDNRTIDDLTGQPAGKSKGSKISYPEVNALITHGLQHTALEMIRWRGGDLKGMFAMNQSIYQTGHASQESLQPRAGEVTSTQLLRTILKAMMLKTTL